MLGPLPRRYRPTAPASTECESTFRCPSLSAAISQRDAIAGRAVPSGMAASGSPRLCLDSGEFCVDAFDSALSDSWNSLTSVSARSRQGDGRPGHFPAEEDLDEESVFWLNGVPAVDANAAADSGMLARAGAGIGRHGETAHRTAPAHPAKDSEPGRISRFKLLDVLGEGHQAIVYRAFDPLLQRQVALKLPRQGAALSSRAIERFLGEARALARLTHPQIVPVYEAGREGDSPYIAMALIEGISLAEQIADHSLSFIQSASIVADLAEALVHAHHLGIVHRDIKPANIRLDHQGMAYLMDFGIAYRSDSWETSVQPGKIVGTPAYVSPEQAQGSPQSDSAASDQYSLGAVFYEMLCGKPPFSGSPSVVLYHKIHGDPISLRTVEPAIPRQLAAICRKAMTREARGRYPGCDALAAELRRWLRGETPRTLRAPWRRWLG